MVIDQGEVPASHQAMDAPAGTVTSGGSHPFRTMLRDPVAVISLVVIGVLALASALAPLLTPYNPNEGSLALTLAPMSRAHPLGADGVGRDVLARLLYGGRISLLGALLAVAIGLLIGVPFGIVSGYFRGRLDSAATWVGNIVLAAPAIIVLLVVMSSAGDSTYLAMVVFGVLLSPSAFRLTRSSVFSVREEPYIEAARVAGLSDLRIMRRHVFPVVIAPSIIQAAEMFGLAIAVQAGIEFLGLGAASEASWGSMLNDAFNNLYNAPILILWPTLAIALTITSLALIANSLRTRLACELPAAASPRDVRESKEPGRPARWR